ncbi:hypothetical protein Hanom_Chr08g00752881 [Helianthus anomalus]
MKMGTVEDFRGVNEERMMKIVKRNGVNEDWEVCVVVSGGEDGGCSRGLSILYILNFCVLFVLFILGGVVLLKLPFEPSSIIIEQ